MMTKILTPIRDVSREDADMEINMVKTFTHHVFRRKKITVTKDEMMVV